MAFDYEGAKKEGYSDSEIIEHLSKKKGFKLDGARKEGYSDQEILQHLLGGEKKSKSLLSEPTSTAGKYGQMLGAIPETLVRGAGEMLGTIGGGLWGAAKGAATLENPFKTGAETAQSWSGAVRDVPRVFAPTEFLEKEVLHPALEAVRDQVGQANELVGKTGLPGPGMAITPQMRKMMSPETQGRFDAMNRTGGEVLFDVWGAAELGRGAGRAISRKPQETGIRELPKEEAVPDQRQFSQQPDLFVEDARARGAAEMQRRQEAARGELDTMAEQRAFLDRELSGQRDMFSEPRFREQVDTGLEARPDRVPPRPVELTPEQLARAEKGEPYVPYDPADPVMGMEATTSRGATPRPLEDVPAGSFEPNRPFFGREDFAGTTGWQVADPRIAEAIANDTYLKGMQTRLARMEENLKGIGEMQGEVAQRYGQRRIGEGGSGQQIGRELVSYTKSMKAVERDIAALKEKIDNRVKMHEERVRKQPKFEKTLDPFKKGSGSRQRGAINPAVFREGFEKIKELAGKPFKLVAYATRDEYGPVFRISARKSDGAEIGSADFIPTRGGLKRLPERDLQSALTEVDPQFQRQGVATEMYKFAHELGNDVIPSTAQTVEGKAMWEGFKAKQVPLSQRGAANFGVSEKVAGMIDKLRRGKDDSTVEVGKTREGRDAILNSAKGEERLPTQALKEIGPDKVPELPTGRFQKGLRWWSNAQMVFNETKNPWVRYIADFTANAKAEAVLYHELLTKNISFGTGRLPTKIIDPNSPHGLWNKISSFDRRVLTDIINKYNGVEWPTRDQIVAMGGKEKHAKMLETLQKPLNDLWKKINEERAVNGKPPMPYRPFYFMKAQGFGPFLVRIKDKDGVTVAFHRLETKFGANKMAQELKKQFEGDGYKIETDIANRATQGNKYNISTTLLEEVYAALDKADPRRAAITSAIADIKSKGGFGAHAARRRDVKGMNLSPENFWKTYDSYIKDGANYIANQKLLKAMNEIQLMKEIPPELRRWSLDHLNMNRGGKIDGLMADVEGFVDSIFGAPGRTRIVNDALSRAFLTSALLFWRPPFPIASALQSTGFAPFALATWKNELGFNRGSATKAFLEGSASFMSKSPEYQAMLQYLAARGKLDPSLVADLSLFGHGGSKFTKWMDHISGSSASKGIEMLGRMHSAAIGMNFLKQNGLKGKELQLGVERFIDDVMGNYSMTDRPGFVQRTGIAGELMKPLSTFQNYFYGNTILSLKHAVEGLASGNIKRAIPFVTMWGSMAVLGGLLSAPFMKEMDKLFTMLKSEGNIIGQTVGPAFRAAWKAAFGETLNEASPSMEERILRSDLPDYGKLGVITGSTQLFDERGIHLGGSLAAPEMMPSAMTGFGWKGTVPGVGFGVDLVSALTTILSDLAGNEKTVQDKRKAYKTLLPGIFDRMLDNYDYQFQSDDNPFSGTLGFGDKPVPGGARGYGTVRRDGFETAASILGGGTIKEVKEKAANRDIKETELDLAAKKSKLVDLGLDAIQRGDTEKLPTYMQKALELGFQDYLEALQTAIMKRMTTEQERERVGNLRQLRQWEYREDIRGQ